MIWTICFLVKENKVCLALKKRGHGVGMWNGTGGKPVEGESLEQTTIRETYEEIKVTAQDITKVAEIEFRDLPSGTSHYATAYICTKWIGEPRETDEMNPAWFNIADIPYDKMWSADKIWVPRVLAGKKIKAVFEYSGGDTLARSEITEL